jgi:hypothetical protein
MKAFIDEKHRKPQGIGAKLRGHYTSLGALGRGYNSNVVGINRWPRERNADHDEHLPCIERYV